MAAFTCNIQSTGILTWSVPNVTSSNEQLELRNIPINPNSVNVTMGIYNAVVIAGNMTHVSSRLTFTAPLELINSNKEIICIQGSGDTEDDIMSCPFVIEGNETFL